MTSETASSRRSGLSSPCQNSTLLIHPIIVQIGCDIRFVRPQPNAAEVNVHWKQEGRGGKADKALGELVKAGRLKRVMVAGERGSRYKIA